MYVNYTDIVISCNRVFLSTEVTYLNYVNKFKKD